MTVALVWNLPVSPSLLAQYVGTRAWQHVRRNMLDVWFVSPWLTKLINKDIEPISCVGIPCICVCRCSELKGLIKC